MTTWILVADRGSARVFSLESYTDNWTRVHAWDNAEGRLREGETHTDRPSSFSAQGENRYTAEPHVDLRHSTAAAFSKQLAEFLDRGRQESKFDEVWIAAPPLMLGEIRKHLPSILTTMVTREWPKDLTHVPDDRIRPDIDQLVEDEDAN